MTDETSRVWQRDDGVLPMRHLIPSMLRGARHRCPSCGDGSLYRAFLKVSDTCPACTEALHHHRADDAPPYFTITIVGHLVIPLVLVVERLYRPELWVHGLLWTTLVIVLSLLLLPAVKGALIGFQWAHYMHGFDPRSGGDEAWDGVGFQSWRGEP